jgi:POT family proton-dependent oligopeptide transporter
VLGQRKTVVVGGVLMALGHFLMAFESFFFPALGLIILGNGCFKPNVSTQVGSLYEPGDHRRDRAYSIFYVGINVGAFISPLLCGWLGERLGWHYGFGAAGVGMCLGLLVYLYGLRYLAPDNLTERKAEHKPANEPLTPDEKKRILALLLLGALNVAFWAAYEQVGNTLALFADQNTDRHILGWEMPASWFQSFNSAMIFLFTPMLTSFWAWQERRGTEPSSVAKMALGCILLGVSFLVLIPQALIAAHHGTSSLGWLTLCTVFMTFGELYLSPVGLSFVTKVAPARMVSMLMGAWFVSFSAGNWLAGWLGGFWEKMPHVTFFIMLAVMNFVVGAGGLLALGPIKRALRRGREGEADV